MRSHIVELVLGKLKVMDIDEENFCLQVQFITLKNYHHRFQYAFSKLFHERAIIQNQINKKIPKLIGIKSELRYE